MDIVGHQKERAQLRKKFTQGRIGQAYLFYGPTGIGKSLCALEFGSILVDEPNFVPTPALPHPLDVMVIRPEEETKKGVTKEKKIPVEAIRGGLSFLASYPSHGKYRVLIIETAEALSLSAGNVLLKTLEEPNPTSVLILVTADKGRLLPTLLSRTEKVRFSFVPLEEMQRAFLEGFRQEKDQALLSFFLLLGRPGLIRRAEEDPLFFSQAREKLGKLFRLSSLSARERLLLAESLATNVPETSQLLEWWLPGLHTLAFKKTETSGRPHFFSFLGEVERTLFLLQTTQANPRLLLEKLFFSIS